MFQKIGQNKFEALFLREVIGDLTAKMEFVRDVQNSYNCKPNEIESRNLRNNETNEHNSKKEKEANILKFGDDRKKKKQRFQSNASRSSQTQYDMINVNEYDSEEIKMRELGQVLKNIGDNMDGNIQLLLLELNNKHRIHPVSIIEMLRFTSRYQYVRLFKFALRLLQVEICRGDVIPRVAYIYLYIYHGVLTGITGFASNKIDS